jgi:hypothetical protein
MLFDNLWREKGSKREGCLYFFLSRLSKFSCIRIWGPLGAYWSENVAVAENVSVAENVAVAEA